MTVTDEAVAKPTIHIIHENEQWMKPLRLAMQEQGLEFVEWNLGKGGMVDFTSEPPQGVFYSRMSASSHTRGHRFACEHTHAVLEWLEMHGRRVINGSQSLLFETSKVRQYSALQSAGIKVPKTVSVAGNYNEEKEDMINKLVATAEQHFPNIPFISKHNRSGRGLGVRLWKEISYFKKYLEKEFATELPVDGIVLLQQYIHSPTSHIIRCEFVGGKFLYAVKVNTTEGFELCPADHCSQIQNFKSKFEIIDFPNPIIDDYARFLNARGIEIAGVELIIDADGNIFTFDINTNTNYNDTAEKNRFGRMTAMSEIAKFLGYELYTLIHQKERIELKLDAAHTYAAPRENSEENSPIVQTEEPADSTQHRRTSLSSMLTDIMSL